MTSLILSLLLLAILFSWLRHQQRLKAGLTTKKWFDFNPSNTIKSPPTNPNWFYPNRIPEEYLNQIAAITFSRDIAERLLLRERAVSGGKDWEWCVNKIRYDIERGR